VFDTFHVRYDTPMFAPSYSVNASVPYVKAAAGWRQAARICARVGSAFCRPTKTKNPQKKMIQPTMAAVRLLLKNVLTSAPYAVALVVLNAGDERKGNES